MDELTPNESTPDESNLALRTTMLRYVAGSLSDADRLAFEERLLSDHDLSDQAAACEQDLIDDYAGERLPPSEKQEVGAWIEASPRRQHRLAVARALPAALSAALTPEAARIPAPGLEPSWTRRARLAAPLAIAACALIAITLYGTGSFMSHSFRAGLVEKPAPVAPSSRQQANTVTAPPAAAAPKADVILLAAERVRGEQPQTLVYTLHRDAPVQVEVILPAHSTQGDYNLQIKFLNSPGKILERKVGSQQTGTTSYLGASLPAGSIPPGAYILRVDHKPETISALFKVVWAND